VQPWRRVTFKFFEMLKNVSEVTLVTKNIFSLKILNFVQSFVECKVSLADGTSCDVGITFKCWSSTNNSSISSNPRYTIKIAVFSIFFLIYSHSFSLFLSISLLAETHRESQQLHQCIFFFFLFAERLVTRGCTPPQTSNDKEHAVGCFERGDPGYRFCFCRGDWCNSAASKEPYRLLSVLMVMALAALLAIWPIRVLMVRDSERFSSSMMSDAELAVRDNRNYISRNTLKSSGSKCQRRVWTWAMNTELFEYETNV
jgi:hypothetical protein